jgi:L-lactate dehydrogenase complex protein LldG
MDRERNISARDAILGSIRDHLAASAPHDAVHAEGAREGGGAEFKAATLDRKVPRPNGTAFSLVEIFSENLKAVGGQCEVAGNEQEIVAALTRIIGDLQKTLLRARRIAISDASVLDRILGQIGVEVDEISTSPGAAELFDYDVGVSTAQAAIAETGTLVLESESERHRLVSLVPPVHIAIVDAADICLTLGEALAAVGRGSELSPTITLITGPSRTADIELTLAIGVHGPQELYVIVNEGRGIRGQRSEVRGQRSEIRGQKSEVRGQRSEVREIRGQEIRGFSDF